VISETQEWYSTAPAGLPAVPEGEGLETGTATQAVDPPAPGSVGEEDRRERRWLLLAALLLGATGRGAAGLSGGPGRWVEDIPRPGNKFLRAGRMVPVALCTGVVRRAGIG
jgi:hypothetical protein